MADESFDAGLRHIPDPGRVRPTSEDVSGYREVVRGQGRGTPMEGCVPLEGRRFVSLGKDCSL